MIFISLINLQRKLHRETISKVKSAKESPQGKVHRNENFLPKSSFLFLCRCWVAEGNPQSAHKNWSRPETKEREEKKGREVSSTSLPRASFSFLFPHPTPTVPSGRPHCSQRGRRLEIMAKEGPRARPIACRQS